MTLNKKQKKHLTIGIVVASIVFLLFVIPMAAIYIMFFDASASRDKYSSKMNYQQIFANPISESLDSSADKKISFSIDEETINKALFSFRTRKYDFARYCSNIEFNFDKSELYLDFQVPLFKTRLKMQTTQSYDEENHSLVLKVNKSSIGRFDNINSFLKNIFSSSSINKGVESMLKGMGSFASLDAENLSFKYDIGDVIYDIYSTGIEDSSSLLAGLLAQAADDNLATLNLESKNIQLDFSSYLSASSYAIEGFEHAIWPIKETLNQYLPKMISDGLFAQANSNTQLKVAKFLVLGYQALNEEEQYLIDDLGLSHYGISDCKKYTGVVTLSHQKDDEIYPRTIACLNEEIEKHSEDWKNGYSFNISFSEEDLYKALNGSNALFAGMAFANLDGSHLHFGVTDNIYLNLLDNSFALLTNFNLDNNHIAHSSVFTKSENKENIFSYAFQDGYFGTQKTKEHANKSMAKILKNNLSNDDPCMSFSWGDEKDVNKVNSDTYKFIFDFNPAIEETNFMTELDSRGLSYESDLQIKDDHLALTFTLKDK